MKLRNKSLMHTVARWGGEWEWVGKQSWVETALQQSLCSRRGLGPRKQELSSEELMNWSLAVPSSPVDAEVGVVFIESESIWVPGQVSWEPGMCWVNSVEKQTGSWDWKEADTKKILVMLTFALLTVRACFRPLVYQCSDSLLSSLSHQSQAAHIQPSYSRNEMWARSL